MKTLVYERDLCEVRGEYQLLMSAYLDKLLIKRDPRQVLTQTIVIFLFSTFPTSILMSNCFPDLRQKKLN